MATEENFENSINLENLLSPFLYEAETPLPKTTPEVPGGFYLSGFISQDCTWGCSYNHSVIKCFPIEKYFEDNRIGSGNPTCNPPIAISSSSYAFPGGLITCATELAIHNQRTSSGTRKLLLGISFTQDNNNRDIRGAVVIFDPLRCLPMKWIEIPEPVSSITVLSHFEEGGSSRPFFNATMMAMVGIAAVGLRGGSVIIVDLGLDDPNLTTTCTVDAKNISELTYKLLYVIPNEYVIATKRHKAVSKRRLIALRFANEPQECDVDEFHYCRPSGESILVLPKNSVAVTCIDYVPSIGSLLVGFTCGTFQIWRVYNMELQFSSEPVNVGRIVPVFGFSFQQPVDDPKNYCYVWAVFGNNSNECGNANVELYSLYYERKTYTENFGFTYEKFRHCVRRLNIELQDDFLSTESESEENSIRCNARPLRIWTQPDTELMFCAWEVGRGGIYYVGAFDLNQWYSNHTKEHIFYDTVTGLCPFWIALPIDMSDVSSIVLDLRIVPKSLMRWENPHAKLDVHLYPASMSFRAVCLTNNGVSAFEHFGVQEKLIRFMLRDGPKLMIQPASLKNSFMQYGLEPVFPHAYGEHLSEKDQDRFFVFSVLLENRRAAAILCLANAWLNGKYANVGCTIDLIIDWIASYMTAIRSVAESQWENLFSFSNDTLPPGTIHFINFSNFAWTSLHMLLITLMNPSEVFTARGLELEDIEFGLEKLVQYSAALLMMYKTNLLPEKDGNFINNLAEYYRGRRSESRSALEASPYVDIQYKNSHPLMVDHLMDALLPNEIIKEEWHTPEGQPLYPPQHVGYLVNMFMWPDADPKAVSRVFMYFLFDLNFMCLESNNATHNSETERRVRGDFKAVMCTAADEYSEIWSLWLLDHGYQDEILVHLKERNRLFETDGLPWCASAVVLTAAGYENDIAELLLRSCPFKLARLLFCLMTSSGTKYSSLAELMVNSSLSTDDELLKQFFQISKARDRLGDFIRTKSKELTEGVKRALLKFLKESNSLDHITLLLMFYIYTEDYPTLQEEFNQVQNTLRHRNLSDSDRRRWKFQENYITHLLSVRRGSEVNNFLRLQTSQTARQVSNTLSIKAVPALESETTTPENSQKGRRVSKLPPQLRRLKLSETISHDPLSPLRRYAGKIQNAVTANTSVIDEEELEMDARIPQRLSRKSFSRRSSIISHRPRFSLANSTVFENSVLNASTSEERLNQTTRANIDLLSLLKTPAIDHRVENKQRLSGNTNMSCTHTTFIGTSEESHSQPAPVHSIMKEKDSSKPKRKVEFDNVSTSEDDEKNETIYEDANDLLGTSVQVLDSDLDAADTSVQMLNSDLDTSVQVLQQDLETADTSVQMLDSDLDTSVQVLAQDLETADTSVQILDSDLDTSVQVLEQDLETADKSCIEPMNTSMDEIQDSPSVPTSINPVPGAQVLLQSVSDQIAGCPVTATRVSTESYQTDESYASVVEDDVLLGVSKSFITNVKETHEVHISTEGTMKTSNIVISDYSEDVFTKPTKPAPSLHLGSPQKESFTGSHTTTENNDSVIVPVQNDVADEREDDVKLTYNTQRKTRSSKSRTPTREVKEETGIATNEPGSSSRTPANADEETQEDFSTKSKPRRTRNSQPRTPTREHADVQDIEPTSSRRATRASRSRTPTREHVEHPEVEEISDRRITRSRTPTRDCSEPLEVDETSARRITRSRTPTRDTAETSDEPQLKRIRQSGRLSRSTTPTRDVAEDILEQSQNQGLPIRRKRRISRSTTPTREMIVTKDDEEKDTSEPLDDASHSRPVRRSARTSVSKTRELFEDEYFEQTERKGVRRSTRSRTPTRDAVEELSEITAGRATRKTVRTSRSVTPTRDVQVEVIKEEPETKSGRRSSRTSRSRDSVGRELEGIPEEILQESEMKVLRKSTRASKTPTREVIDESGDVGIAEVKSSRKGLKTSQSKSKQTPPIAESTSLGDDDDNEDSTSEPLHLETVPKIKKQAKPRAPKRRLKYFDHHQDLSTLIEDTSTEVSVPEVSVLDATVLPPAAAQPPPRRIKGIRARTDEPEPEVEVVQNKPSKRRKATDDEVLHEEDSDQVSNRSSRSASSKRSAGSSKAKGSRRKARSSSQSTA